ncbi:hypothetical protein PSTT_13742 [Puccinia striiformis]|uniref:Uncharacterized protein n=1 Tax=Puccinia striiformis TaxID=27350 RepID=A0A2S4UQH3_9BASI|nr:hypothetical protein PSTT_13742 [Puccinia striiformis]
MSRTDADTPPAHFAPFCTAQLGCHSPTAVRKHLCNRCTSSHRLSVLTRPFLSC